MSQALVWDVTITLMALVTLGFLFVALNSRARIEDFGPLQRRAYRLRAGLFVLLAIVFGTTMILTLRGLPYDAPRTSGEAAVPQVVQATGQMWNWTLSQNQLQLNRPVEFQVTSTDVNHGFGIYDPDLRLIGQTQAMPGYTNTLRHTFTRPGTYKVLCLEYCGMAHHNMVAEFTVAAQ